ncbi:MAG: xylulose kinase, partial [Brachybacterium sp.]
IAPEGEYVALGAARQAAWALSGSEQPPAWTISGSRTVGAEPTPEVLGAYRALKERTESWG